MLENPEAAACVQIADSVYGFAGSVVNLSEEVRMGRYLLVALALCAAACGNSPTAPSTTPPPPAPAPAPQPVPPPPTVATIAGTYSGSIDANHPDVGRTRYAITVTLEQADRQVTGTWRLRPPDSAMLFGEITGTLSGVGSDTTFSGTSTWSGETTSGTGRCLGRAGIRGPAAGALMTWSSEDVSFTGCSGTLTGVVWTLVSSR